MRVASVLFLVLGTPVFASAGAQSVQQPDPSRTSSAGVTPSSPEDGAPPAATLDRIRGLLAEPAPVQQSLDRERPTFRVQIEERDRFEDLMRGLKFEAADRALPIPGGWYGYEQQRIVRTVTGIERLEPYAAFSGPEFLTLAIEGLLGKYPGSQIWGALGDSARARAMAAAREEVARAVHEYCTAQAGDSAGLLICSNSFRP